MAKPSKNIGRTYRAVASIVRPVSFATMRHEWRHAERLPDVGTGFVAVANHISHVDFIPFAHFLYDNGRPPRYLAKESLFRIPVIGRIIKACGQIPVYRESADAAKAYNAAVTAVDKGECVGIYPEGTITRDPDLWPMTGRTGAARIALETGCDVVPIAQWGAQDILAPYSKRVRLLPRKKIQVIAGDPVELDDLRVKPVTRETIITATSRIMDDLTALVAELRGEPAPAQRFNPRAEGVSTTGDPRRARKSAAGDGRGDASADELPGA